MRALSTKDGATVSDRLARLIDGWNEIEPTQSLRELAIRLLRVHPLGTAEALQFAAALVASERGPSLQFVCLDERLTEAAEKRDLPWSAEAQIAETDPDFVIVPKNRFLLRPVWRNRIDVSGAPQL